MSIINRTIDELIDLAINTSNLSEMLLLQNNPSMNVRRALLSNRNITTTIVENLELDPVANVSYLASQHPKASKKRDFEDELRPCVLCSKSEKGLVCMNCPEVKDHSF